VLSVEKAASDILQILARRSLGGEESEPEMEIIDTQVYNSPPPSPQTVAPSSPGETSQSSIAAPKGKGKTILPQKTGGRQKRKSVPKPKRSLDTVCISLSNYSIY